MTDLGRIEKQILLRAPRTRAWRAITDASEFGSWFLVALEGQFEVGRTVGGRLTVPDYEHLTMSLVVGRMDPEEYFSYRWHPYAVDPAVDYSTEPMTLVEFRLQETPEGTLLTIVESGFDQLPPGRRGEAFRMNEGGWTAQMENVRRHVAG